MACKALTALLRAANGPTLTPHTYAFRRPSQGHSEAIPDCPGGILPALFVKGRRVNVDPDALARAIPLAQAGCSPETFLYTALGDSLRTILATEPGDATIREIAAMLLDDFAGEPWPDL